jgi:hypothetical protein
VSDDVTTTGRLPDFLILGAAKSGTTSLSAWLDARADVFVPPQKELHFFSRDDQWARGVSHYTDAFDPAGARLAGEATPNYLARDEVTVRAAQTVPDARLIALLREPVDRAWSHHSYDRELGIADVSFDDVAASVGTPDEHWYLEQGRYLRHLARWCEQFPRDHLLVLWFDDLRDRPLDTYRTVCEFLDLDPAVVPDEVGSVRNAHYRLRAPWVRQQMLRWRAWSRLPFNLAPRIDGWLRSEKRYDAIDPAVAARLRGAFAADNDALAAWLDEPLPAAWREAVSA